MKKYQIISHHDVPDTSEEVNPNCTYPKCGCPHFMC
jgi:hypothetical protein